MGGHKRSFDTGSSIIDNADKLADSVHEHEPTWTSHIPSTRDRVRATLLDAPPENGKRMLLYICPECGDIACEAYSVMVRRERESYIWNSFAYQTSERELKEVEALGPFVFNATMYKAAVLAAATFAGTAQVCGKRSSSERTIDIAALFLVNRTARRMQLLRQYTLRASPLS